MLCETIKEGVDCFFMKKDGCQFSGGACHQIIDVCIGCNRIQEYPTGKYCNSFPEPTVKWKNGNCNMATHIKVEAKVEQKINPLKASKRGGR
jgi:hypothetical protein